MNSILNALPSWSSWLALGLYWLPLAVCAYGYTIRAASQFSADRAARQKADSENGGYYVPDITIGTLVGYVFLAAMPVANLFAAIFDVAPKLFRGLIQWFAKALDIPLVPKRPK